MPNLAPRLAAILDPFGQPALAGVAQLGNCEVEQALDLEPVPADAPEHDEPRHRRRRSGHDEPAPRRLAERIEPLGQTHRRAEPTRDSALGQRYRETAFSYVVCILERLRPDAMADGVMRITDRGRLHDREFPTGRPSQQLGQLG